MSFNNKGEVIICKSESTEKCMNWLATNKIDRPKVNDVSNLHFSKKDSLMQQGKYLLIGDYLIDDRMENGAADFNGELLPFGWAYKTEEWNEYRTWDDILKRLL